mmetsp:Transcript_29916/g.92462  ORF Transcript_29916/g.92462 Transcript_29916/m.92462 type:complete len:243 (+) Transcript_29916:941-1669(+)
MGFADARAAAEPGAPRRPAGKPMATKRSVTYVRSMIFFSPSPPGPGAAVVSSTRSSSVRPTRSAKLLACSASASRWSLLSTYCFCASLAAATAVSRADVAARFAASFALAFMAETVAQSMLRLFIFDVRARGVVRGRARFLRSFVSFLRLQTRPTRQRSGRQVRRRPSKAATRSGCALFTRDYARRAQAVRHRRAACARLRLKAACGGGSYRLSRLRLPRQTFTTPGPQTGFRPPSTARRAA